MSQRRSAVRARQDNDIHLISGQFFCSDHVFDSPANQPAPTKQCPFLPPQVKLGQQSRILGVLKLDLSKESGNLDVSWATGCELFQWESQARRPSNPQTDCTLPIA